MGEASLPNPFTLTACGAELFDRVEPLWLQLREHHADLSPRWAGQLLAASFEERRAGLIAKASAGLLVLSATTSHGDVAYCVSTATPDGNAEVDSLYVAEAHREQGIGHALMSRTLDWFNERAIGTVVVDVLSLNEPARRFYERYGLYSRTVRMMRLPDASLA